MNRYTDREGTPLLIGWLVSRRTGDDVSVQAAATALGWTEERVKAILRQIAFDGLAKAAARYGYPMSYCAGSAQLVGDYSTVAYPLT